MPGFVADRQLLPAFGTPGGQYFSAVGGSHPVTETVLVPSLSP